MPPIHPLAYLIEKLYEIGIIIWCLIVGVREMATIQEPVKERKPIERDPALWIASLVLYSPAGLIAFAIRPRTPVISSVWHLSQCSYGSSTSAGIDPAPGFSSAKLSLSLLL